MTKLASIRQLTLFIIAAAGAALVTACAGDHDSGGDHAEGAIASEFSAIPTRGADEPLVAVTVFCDYQCPACRAAHRTLDTLVSQFGNDVQVRYRQFPLIGSHRLARDAAVYALAAHRQGRFDCMNAVLYREQPAWDELSPEAFREKATEYAVSCHADEAQFSRDIDDPTLGQQVDDEAEVARQLEPRGGTPTVYVNGLPPAPPRPTTPHARLLIPRIRSELREAKVLLERGIPRAEMARQKTLGNTGDTKRTSLILGH